MFKKKKNKKEESTIIISFDLNRLDKLNREIKSFIDNNCVDDIWVDDDSIQIDIMSDGKIKISGRAVCDLDSTFIDV